MDSQYNNFFVELLQKYSSNIILHNDQRESFSYLDVFDLSRKECFRKSEGQLVICFFDNDIWGIAGYLALLGAGAVPMLMPTKVRSDKRDALLDLYRPSFIWMPSSEADFLADPEKLDNFGGYTLIKTKEGSRSAAVGEELALLLSTSGSTGSEKFVRLSHKNIWSNATAIADYLRLSETENPVTSLPPSYSYGLSVIHSHLVVGAKVAVIGKGLFDKSFWSFIREANVTSFAGVPYHYEMLKKLKFTGMNFPELRYLTQAGGRLDPELKSEFTSFCEKYGKQFVTMYGQTEAGPRMAYLPAEDAVIKADSIGIAIPGGSFELVGATGELINGKDTEGELVYYGPNVCMGYACCRGDLVKSDDNKGRLLTGDIAVRDCDGYYRIVGRKKRFIKLFGNRISLDDVESYLLKQNFEVACVGRDDSLEVFTTVFDPEIAKLLKKTIASFLHSSSQGISIYGINGVPRSSSGKTQYAKLLVEEAELLA